jgi:LPS sulfotransferase NodH
LKSIWHTTAIDRRWTEAELSSAAFDSANEPCSRRVLLLASQRTASWTACRFLMAAGWGVPCEYFIRDRVFEFYSRFYGPPRASIPYAELGRYRRELEERRSRNGIFSTKVFWSDYGRLRAAFSTEEELIEEAVHIFLYRRDFGGQIISGFVAADDGQFSFTPSNVAAPSILCTRSAAEEAEVINMIARNLLKEELSWFREFKARGWRPFAVASEALLAAPQEIMTGIAASTGLRIDHENIARCQQFETGGRYTTGSVQKSLLRARHAALLDELDQRRRKQFKEFGPEATDL